MKDSSKCYSGGRVVTVMIGIGSVVVGNEHHIVVKT